MTGMPWFKCFPQAMLNGMGGMPADERGVYISILCLIYREGGPVRDEPREMAYNTGCTVRAWVKYRAALILHGKLYVTQIGGRDYLTNERCEIELAATRARSEQLAEIGSRGGKISGQSKTRKANENNVSEEAEAKPTLSQGQAIIDTDLEVTPQPPRGSDQPVKPDDVDDAFRLWNETAELCGLPIARTLDDNRRRAIRKRLDVGGLPVWRDAMVAVQRSAFLRGLRPSSDGRKFKADLTFVCQAKSYQRLVDGGYGVDATRPSGAKPDKPADDAVIAHRVQHWRDTGEWKAAWGRPPQEQAA